MFLFKKKMIDLKAYTSGKMIPIESVNDEVFSSKMMGDGIAIQPNCGQVVSPCDGTIEVVFAGSEHAVGIKMDNGVEILIHCGLNTVNLKDGTFKAVVKQGDRVKCGQLLLEFDQKKLKKMNYDDVIMGVVLDKGKSKEINFIMQDEVISNQSVIAQIK